MNALKLVQGRGSFFSGVAIVAGGNVIAQAIPVLATPLLTRLYTPENLGLLGLFFAFINVGTNVTSFGYAKAIVSARTEAEGMDLVSMSLLLTIPSSLVVSLLLQVLIANDLLGYGELPVWTVFVAAVSLSLTGIFLAARYWQVRVGNYEPISRASVIQSAARIASQVALGFAGLGSLGLILGEVIGRGFGMSQILRSARNDMREQQYVAKLEEMVAVAKRFRKFPLLTVPSSLMNSLALNLPVPLILAYFGVNEAGQFTIASRILLLPVSIVGASVGDVFHSRIAKISRESPAAALGFFLRVSGGLFLFGLMPMLIVAAIGEELFTLVLGSEWEIAGAIASVITPWLLMQLTVSPVARVVQVYQGQEMKLIFDLLSLFSIVGVLSLGHARDWSLLSTVTLLGISQAVVYLIHFLLLIRIIQRNKMINDMSQGTA